MAPKKQDGGNFFLYFRVLHMEFSLRTFFLGESSKNNFLKKNKTILGVALFFLVVIKKSIFFSFDPPPEKLRCLALVGWGMGVVVPWVVGCRDRDFQIPRTRFSPSTNFQWNPTILNFYTAPPLFWTDKQVLANGSIVECRTDLNSIDLLFCIFSKGVTSYTKNNMAASLATVANGTMSNCGTRSLPAMKKAICIMVLSVRPRKLISINEQFMHMLILRTILQPCGARPVLKHANDVFHDLSDEFSRICLHGKKQNPNGR